MRRLTDRFDLRMPTQPRIRDEGGAVLVLVALGLVVLIGFVAITVDVGRIYSERRELQNGADAAALAVAQDCALGNCGGGYDPYPVAEQYADANASDGLASVDALDIDLNQQRVYVRAITEDPGGDNFFDMTFAKVLGYDGLTVGADSTVAWGSTSKASTLAITFSECEWDNISLVGNLFPSTVVTVKNSLPPASGLTTLYLHGAKGPCGPPPSGQNGPGGFGFLKESAGPCEALVADGQWTQGDTAPNVSQNCKTALAAAIGTVQLIPYYDRIRSQGNPLEYKIVGLGPFYVTGFKGPGLNLPSVITGNDACTRNDFCIEGFALETWFVSGEPGGNGKFGAMTTWFVN